MQPALRRTAYRQFRAACRVQLEATVGAVFADASDGVASLGPLIKLGAVAFVVLGVLAFIIEGSNVKLIRHARRQVKSDTPRTEADRVTGSDET